MNRFSRLSIKYMDIFGNVNIFYTDSLTDYNVCMALENLNVTSMILNKSYSASLWVL